MGQEKDKDNPQGLPPDFDTTAELWDRLVDDITGRGAPCMETMERLVSDACQANPAPMPGSKKDR